MTKVALIVGSLRTKSFSERWAKNIISMLPEGWEGEIVPINELPLYNQDFDNLEYNGGEVRPEIAAYRQALREHDAVIFVTPEHNRTMSAAMKNAIDTASRGDNLPLDGKPGMVVSHSMATIGGALANHNVRSALITLGVNVMQKPEVYLPQSHNLLDEEGHITKEDTREFLQSAVDAFVEYAAKFL